ncbi:MAG: cell division protein ZapB [Spirochaetales bacterium]|nr:cell division protein ZapB [Spirochaetales bacterium]
MIRIDQIKILEDRVDRAIELIKTLREENRTLRAGLDSAQKKIDELEGFIDTFKTEQGEIEEGILRALANLDKIEDEVLTTPEGEPSADISDDSKIVEKAEEEHTAHEGKNNSSELDIF